jgi:hypothetical protein
MFCLNYGPQYLLTVSLKELLDKIITKAQVGNTIIEPAFVRSINIVCVALLTAGV